MNGKEFAIFVNDTIGNIVNIIDNIGDKVELSYDIIPEYMKKRWIFIMDKYNNLQYHKININTYKLKCNNLHIKYLNKLSAEDELSDFIYMDIWLNYISKISKYIYLIYKELCLDISDSSEYKISYNDFIREITVYIKTFNDIIKRKQNQFKINNSN